MTVRKNIYLLLLTILLAWFGGIGSVRAQVSQSGENAYVKYLCGSQGFNIQFKYNGTWQKTTYNDQGYRTLIKIGDGDSVQINSSNFAFGTPYEVDGKVTVSIEASIDPARPWSVNITYTIQNLTSSDLKIKLGSCADTQVGNDDSADIERVGHNAIMMTAVNGTNAGAKYGITAGEEPFTTLWYGYYSLAQSRVFTDNGGVSGEGVYEGTSKDSGLAWSWTFDLAGNATKVITCGGLAPAIKMGGYRYGDTPSTPSITIEGDPTVTYYYNNSDSNTGGTAWSTVTSTSLAPGTYYMYAHVVPGGSEPEYNTPTTPFRVARATPQGSDFAYTAPSNLVYDGTQKSATVTTNLSGVKTGMGTITVVRYFQGSTELSSAPTNAGTYTVKIDVAQGDNYNAATDITADNWTFTIYKRPIETTTITVADIGYDALAHNTINQLTVKYGNFTIPNSNYTVEPASITEAGIYTLTIVGTSNLFGSTKKELRVTKDIATYSSDIRISASNVQITPIPTQIYDGTYAAQPTFYIFDNDKLLTPTNDYTFNYGDNNTEGTNTGTVTIYGAGVYSGSTTLTFDIVNEYFTEDNIAYHATSSKTVSVGTKTHTAAIETTTTGITIPASVTHVAIPFQVTGVENGAFTGCSSLRYIDLNSITGYTPSTLERTIAASPFYGVPKQALVYLNGTSIKGENYVYKVGDADYRCQTFKIYDDISGSQTAFSETNGYEWKLENRHSFTAYTVENTRQLTAGKHYTVCLPYDLPLPSTLKAYIMDGTNTANTLIGFAEVTGTLTAYKPYVIIPSTSGQPLGTTNVEVSVFTETDDDAKTLGAVTAGIFTFYGTMRYMDGTDATGLYIMQYNNGNPTWMQIAAGSGFNQSNKACILPMRAYIKNTASAAPPYINASFTDASGTTTTVNQLHLDKDDAEEKMCDLSGRQVKTPRKGNLYIINHRIVRK